MRDGRDRAEPALLEVLERLRDLGLGVHDERTGPRDGLAYGQAAQQHDLECRVTTLLVLVRADRDRLAVPEDSELARGDGPALTADVAVAAHDVDQGVEVGAP